MSLLKKFKSFFRGTSYRINRDILISYVNSSIKLSKECDLCSVDEFYLSPSEDEVEEHIVITNNDATCDCPLESEKHFTGFTFYVNRTSYYDPKKDEIYRSIEELIRFKLADFPEWFILRNNLVAPEELEAYKLK